MCGDVVKDCREKKISPHPSEKWKPLKHLRNYESHTIEEQILFARKDILAMKLNRLCVGLAVFLLVALLEIKYHKNVMINTLMYFLSSNIETERRTKDVSDFRRKRFHFLCLSVCACGCPCLMGYGKRTINLTGRWWISARHMGSRIISL